MIEEASGMYYEKTNFHPKYNYAYKFNGNMLEELKGIRICTNSTPLEAVDYFISIQKDMFGLELEEYIHSKFINFILP